MRRRRATTCSPVTGFSPGRSYSSQYRPEPRFCHAGRSLKLMPFWKSSSFLPATDRPLSAAVASPTSRPCLPQQPVAVGVQGVAVGVLAPPAEVIDDELRRGQLRDAAVEHRHRPQQQRELGAGLAGEDREQLAELPPEAALLRPEEQGDLVALGVAVDHVEPAAGHQVLGGLPACSRGTGGRRGPRTGGPPWSAG